VPPTGFPACLKQDKPDRHESEAVQPSIRIQGSPKIQAFRTVSANFVQIIPRGGAGATPVPCAAAALTSLISVEGSVPCRDEKGQKGKDVKLIIAAIKPFKLEEVREALTAIGVRGMMVTEIKGFGSQSGHTEIYRGAEYAVNFVPKVRLEIVVSDALSDQVVSTIAKTAKTEKIGDGKIFVVDVEHAVRVRTGETDDDAL
jgi:nitrogen regulatory protein PII